MNLDFGDRVVGSVFPIRFWTEGADGTPTSMAGSPALRARKGSGSGSVSTAGITLTQDVVTGQHVIDMDLSADGTFYAAPSEVFLEFTAGTLGGISLVGKIAARFSIENRNIKANVTQFGGSNGAFSGGRPEVNTTHWSGTAVAAANVLIDGAITAAKIASDAITSSKVADEFLTAAKFASGAFDAVWSVATRVLTAATNLTTALATPTNITAGTITTVTNVTNDVGITQAGADKVWGSAARTLTSFGTLVADVATAVWAAATRTLSAFGFTPSLHADYDAAKTAATQASVDAVGAIVGSGTHGNAALKTLIDAVDDYVDTEVAAIKAKTDNLPGDPADASDIAASFASIASTLATIAAYIDTEVAAIKAKTDNLPAAPAATGDIPTAVQNADALLGRNIAGGSNGGRDVTSALRAIRNKVNVDATTVTVYQENDTTEAWTGTATRTSGLNPLQTVDPS